MARAKTKKNPTENDLKNDFRLFLIYVWRTLLLPDPTPVQLDIAYWLQHGEAPKTGKIRRRIVEAFRGVGKSWITATYAVWLLWRNVNERILVVSASKDRADAFSIFVKRLFVEVPLVAHLSPDKNCRNSNVAFDVAGSSSAQAPSVKSVGISGQITGSRASRIFADDIETLQNSMTVLMRERLLETVKEFDAVIMPDVEAEILYLGTPQSEESIYNALPKRGYKIRVWTARIPEDVSKYGHTLAPMVLDKAEKIPKWSPVDTRFGEEDLVAREMSYGRSGFMLQFMLDTTMSDAEKYPLKLQDFIVHPCRGKYAPDAIVWGSGPDCVAKDLPALGLQGDFFNRPMHVSKEFGEYEGAVLAIDPSGRGKDEVGYCVAKMRNATIYVTRWGGLQGGYSEETLRALAMMAKTEEVNQVLIEPNFGDGMFLELFKPVINSIYTCKVEHAEHASGQKEVRIIQTCEPALNQHRIVIDPKVIEEDAARTDPVHSNFYQLTRLTKDRNALPADDRIDVFHIAINRWMGALARSQQKAQQSSQDRRQQAELRKFMNNIFGKRPAKPKMLHLPGR